MPGFLPERLQDELHGGESVLPEEVNALDAANSRLLPRVRMLTKSTDWQSVEKARKPRKLYLHPRELTWT